MGECEIKVNGREGMAMAEEMARKQSKKIPNLKASGRDGVQGFWLKKLVQLRKNYLKQLNNCLDGSSILPTRMTKGRSIQCLKDSTIRNAVNNFRLKSCLPLYSG